MPESGWLQQAGARSRWLLPWKTLGTPAAIGLFLWIYFLLLYHPIFHVTQMPLTPLDRWIGFQAWSIVPYASLWLYISLAALLVHGSRELRAYLIAVSSVAGAGCLIFLLWPTAIPPVHIDWALHPSVDFLKSIDAAGNACPSLHAAFVTLSGVWLNRQLHDIAAPVWLRALNAIWCLLVLYSTLATKQHVAVDLAAGVALGLGVALPLQAWLRRSQPATHAAQSG